MQTRETMNCAATEHGLKESMEIAEHSFNQLDKVDVTNSRATATKIKKKIYSKKRREMKRIRKMVVLASSKGRSEDDSTSGFDIIQQALPTAEKSLKKSRKKRNFNKKQRAKYRRLSAAVVKNVPEYDAEENSTRFSAYLMFAPAEVADETNDLEDILKSLECIFPEEDQKVMRQEVRKFDDVMIDVADHSEPSAFPNFMSDDILLYLSELFKVSPAEEDILSCLAELYRDEGHEAHYCVQDDVLSSLAELFNEAVNNCSTGEGDKFFKQPTADDILSCVAGLFRGDEHQDNHFVKDDILSSLAELFNDSDDSTIEEDKFFKQPTAEDDILSCVAELFRGEGHQDNHFVKDDILSSLVELFNDSDDSTGEEDKFFKQPTAEDDILSCVAELFRGEGHQDNHFVKDDILSSLAELFHEAVSEDLTDEEDVLKYLADPFAAAGMDDFAFSLPSQDQAFYDGPATEEELLALIGSLVIVDMEEEEEEDFWHLGD